MLKKVKILEKYLKNPPTRWCDECKNEFRLITKAALIDIKKLLKPVEVSMYFEKSGSASSGCYTAFFMFSDTCGIYISINADMVMGKFGRTLCRTVTHIKDYSGGTNNFINIDRLSDENMWLNCKQKGEKLCE